MWSGMAVDFSFLNDNYETVSLESVLYDFGDPAACRSWKASALAVSTC